MRDQEARRTTVLWLKRLTIILEGDHTLTLNQVVHRQIGRVAAVTERHHIFVGRLNARILEEGVDRNALPASIKLGPLGDAVDVRG